MQGNDPILCDLIIIYIFLRYFEEQGIIEGKGVDLIVKVIT